MSDVSGTVVPLRPTAPTPEVRGWHGMIARDQAKYRPDDWQIWAALANDDARLVEVAPGSPAWFADLRDGAWITAMNGGPFESFHGAIGDVIEVRAQMPGIGPVIRKLVLAAPPLKKAVKAPRGSSRVPKWKHEPPVLAGKRVFKDSRPAFLEFAARHPHVRRHVWFLMELLKREWRKGIILKHKTIAEAAGCHVSTVKLSQSCCQHFGFCRVTSGKRSRKHNTFEVCWPAGSS